MRITSSPEKSLNLAPVLRTEESHSSRDGDHSGVVRRIVDVLRGDGQQDVELCSSSVERTAYLLAQDDQR